MKMNKSAAISRFIVSNNGNDLPHTGSDSIDRNLTSYKLHPSRLGLLLLALPAPGIKVARWQQRRGLLIRDSSCGAAI